MVSGASWLNPLSWPIEPWVLLGLELTAVLYLWGGHRPAHARAGRKSWAGSRWRPVSFWSGLLIILLALDSPLEAMARQLFWAHMTQHLLLIVVAAPLLVAGAPGLRIWRGLPRAFRRPVAKTVVKSPRLAGVRSVIGWAAGPVGAWLLSSGNLWFWHWPAAYDLTLKNHSVHHLEHALFLGLGLLFWAQVIDQPPFHCRLNQFRRGTYVFLAAVQAWALAALLGFASAPYYAYARLPARPDGMSALSDQQLGAGIMWVPGSITYSIVIVACIFLWLRDEDRVAQSFSPQPAGVAPR